MNALLRRLTLQALMGLLPLLATQVAAGPAYLSVCNESTTTPMYVAQASRYNWGYSYATFGWQEIAPGSGGYLGMSCVYLEGITPDPIQFAIAHRDDKGEMALYAYEFPIGAGVKAGESWFCVRLDRRFRFEARGFEELANCEPGSTRIKFYHYLEFEEDDKLIIRFKPNSKATQHKIATFSQIAKGRFGAVAIHPKTRKTRASYEHLAPQEAVDAALSDCGSAECEVVMLAQAKCLAVSHGRTHGSKVGSGATLNEALAAAESECKRAFGECQKAKDAGCSTRD